MFQLVLTLLLTPLAICILYILLFKEINYYKIFLCYTILVCFINFLIILICIDKLHIFDFFMYINGCNSLLSEFLANISVRFIEFIIIGGIYCGKKFLKKFADNAVNKSFTAIKVFEIKIPKALRK